MTLTSDGRRVFTELPLFRDNGGMPTVLAFSLGHCGFFYMRCLQLSRTQTACFSGLLNPGVGGSGNVDAVYHSRCADTCTVLPVQYYRTNSVPVELALVHLCWPTGQPRAEPVVCTAVH